MKIVLLHPNILLILLLFSVVNCNSKNNPPKKEKHNLEFNINYELLNNKPITDESGFRMNIPINWKPLDSLSKSQLNQTINALKNTTKLKLVNSYQSPLGSQCVIAKVITNKKDFSFISEDIISNIQTQIQGDGYKTNELNINNLNAKQYLIRGKNYVIIKLYIQLKDFYQIDFIIPLSKYKSEIESVESSLGTIEHKGEL